MLLTITNRSAPASNLGFLLHKHPERTQSFDLAFGRAHVWYSENRDDVCTAHLLVEVDPINLVRGGRPQERSLFEYVNDRPYVASSFLSVAVAQVFTSALNGRCNARPELVSQPLEVEATIPVVPCREGEAMLRRLFEPLGYRVDTARLPLDESFPEWGESQYYRLTLHHQVPLQVLLDHLYVLIPVLDDAKHYYVDDEEVEKLMRHGASWLANHPHRESIVQRYLKRRRHLVDAALARLTTPDETDDEVQEEALEKPISLQQLRLQKVRETLEALPVKTVVDLGCGEGSLLRSLLEVHRLEKLLGVDVSMQALQRASERLRLDTLPERVRTRIELVQGALNYRDKRIEGFDAACLVEVIEHVDPDRLPALERVVFAYAEPRYVIVTTPNQEYNTLFETLPSGHLRHRDHRFEWTRPEFQSWAHRIGHDYRYSVRIEGIGKEHESLGCPTQMAVFTKT